MKTNTHLMTLDQMLKVEGNAREAALQGERDQKSETGAVSDCGFAGIARSPVKSVPGAHGPNVQWIPAGGKNAVRPDTSVSGAATKIDGVTVCPECKRAEGHDWNCPMATVRIPSVRIPWFDKVGPACPHCRLQIVPGQIHVPTSQDNTCIVKAESKTRTETAIEYRKQDAVLLEYLLQVGERMKHGEVGHAAVRVGEDVYTVRVVNHNFESMTVIERKPFNPAIRNL